MSTVCLTRTLQCVDVGVCNYRTVYFYTVYLRINVFQLTGLVVDAFAPVPGLLFVIHIQHSCIGKHLTQVLGTGFQFGLHIGKYKTPQPTVESLESITALFAVVGFATQCIEICQETVVTQKKSRITVIESDKPQRAIPSAHYHILHSLVHVRAIISDYVIGQQIGNMEIL